MKLNKMIIVNAGLAAALSLAGLTGCATDGSEPKDYFPKDDGHRATQEFMNAQATAGAREDATLTAAHFTGSKLNSLGTEKLARMVPDESGDQVTVYLSTPAGDLSNHRRDAVIAFLKNAGVEESNIKFQTGGNESTNHPAAHELTNLPKTNTGGANGETASTDTSTSSTGGSSGGSGSGGMMK